MQQNSKIRSILKEKGTLSIETLSSRLNCSEEKARKLILDYFISVIQTLSFDANYQNTKYLFKVFKYFENIENENEKKYIENTLKSLASICERRIKKFKNNKNNISNSNMLQKFLDSINVTLINFNYKDSVKNDQLTTNQVSYNLLKYLILDVKNFNYLLELLKMFPENLIVKNENGIYLIEELIDKYINIVQENNSNLEIIYFEKVIKLFISNSKFNIEKNVKDQLVYKLDYTLNGITNSELQNKEKNKSSFFIKELINDIKAVSKKGRDVQELNYKYDINPIFSAEVLNESEKMITLENKLQVLDCRDKYTVTIDGETTWVYDDACSIERLENGNFLLGIYVTDATIAVPRNSAVDLEARKRAESIYLGGSVVTMLPIELTKKLTLKQNNDRNAIGYFFELDQNVNCVNFSVRRCLINVDNNYGYEKVNSMISDTKNIEEIKNIKDMYYIACKFHEKGDLRMQYRTLKKIKKAMDSNSLNANTNENTAAIMISDFMTLTNAYVANYFNEHPEIPFIYRINLASYSPDTIKRIKAISEKEISFEDMRNYINYICPPSAYSITNMGHSGLSLPAYCHSTNPLRNYSSLEIERIVIDHMINDGRDINLEESREYLKNLCDYMNERLALNSDYMNEVKRSYKRR